MTIKYTITPEGHKARNFEVQFDPAQQYKKIKFIEARCRIGVGSDLGMLFMQTGKIKTVLSPNKHHFHNDLPYISQLTGLIKTQAKNMLDPEHEAFPWE